MLRFFVMSTSNRYIILRIGLTDRKEGDLGPIYGFQWRHSGAKYAVLFIFINFKYSNELSLVKRE